MPAYVASKHAVIGLTKTAAGEVARQGGFGSYGDILVRDRKMYVAPKPFVLADGTAPRRTLIVPHNQPVDADLIEVGALTRREVDRVVVGYSLTCAPMRLPHPCRQSERGPRTRIQGLPRPGRSGGCCYRPCAHQILAGLGAAEAAVEDDED